MKDLSNYRKSYEKSELLETNIPEDPINLFHKWFYETEEFGNLEEVNAMTVATIGLDGFPKSRVVLLKKFNEEGFIFYTNYNSEKGKAIINNPNVCLSFFWQTMERQVIIKGIAEKTSDIVSDNYFNSRPDGSKLGAIVSSQSETIPSRDFLDNKLKELENEYEGKEIPRPNHWGGFLIRPIEVEFWQGRANRLHDRIRYKLEDNYNWKIDRLSP
ncbi:pyridoxamine 5'-phosphate oxidase [Flavobacterium dankookense]|jgi:pyridoxamine 5'-phosphate oxidase|uniref:Pyridoxine/pyridoxamine 5'-phosphate oxidase n=1 Tax=Flavobacterium dankookense TaxID=706186 RepID=A0A4R6QDM4_9FLAO|nr:pyridoxamine 5'-phosphate oxidase [Flavobacterium dankookense]TDP59529.1 pyridoxamine 5'-phosphate oxidase [Flavobacterium dankookense]